MFSKPLAYLKEKNIFRRIKDRASPQGSRIIINGKEYINFSSNDYLGLANHPHLIEAAQRSMKRFGFGSGASRLLSGGSALHEKLEMKIARFKSTESALIFNSGYSANTGIIPAIAGKGDVIFSDELNHASIIDGCRLSRAKTIVYRHKDTLQLETLIKKTKAKRKIIVTDSVFSMNGDIAPLKEIYKLCASLNLYGQTRGSSGQTHRSAPTPSTAPTNCILYIDDAHATGVLGNGKGSLEYFKIKPEPWIIQMGTFSKALGSFGAFGAGSRDTINWIINAARSFIFSTALPSCVIAASIAALELIEKNPKLIKRLWSNRDKLVIELTKLGCDIMGSETPIIPIKTGSIKKTLEISQSLFEKGIYVSAIRPPAVKEPRIRITVTAAHTNNDIKKLISALSL